MKDAFKILLLIAVASVIRYYFGLDNCFIGIDDSNIYFVYAKNLQMGYGFVYNPGGERVEGFTSIAWTLILSAIYALKFIPFELSILVLSFFITTGTVFLYFRFVKDYFKSEMLGWLTVLYIILIPGFIEWNVFSLMDVCLWIFAVSWLTLLFIDEKSDSKIFLVLLIALPFIRPEGMAVSPIFVFLKIVKDYFKLELGIPAVKKNSVYILAVAGSIAMLAIFRIFYFGYPLPNTFYAKVSMSMQDNITGGIRYIYHSLRHTSVVPFVIIAINLVSMSRFSFLKDYKKNQQAFFLAILILFFLIYPFLSGGDHFKYSRFYQPVFPIIGLLFLLLFKRRIFLQKPVGWTIIILFLLITNLNTSDTSSPSLRNDWRNAALTYVKEVKLDFFQSSQLQTEFDIAVNGRKLAQYLNNIFADCATMPSYGVVAAGGIGYSYDGKVIDLMGLNNLKMAHADKIKISVLKNHGSFNKKVFMEQLPEVFLSWPDYSGCNLEQDDKSAILFAKQLRDPEFFWNGIFKDIFNDPDFVKYYSFCKISNHENHIYSFISIENFASKYPELKITNMDALQDAMASK